MGLRFYNTLSGQVEEFKPLEEKRVRIYTCGLTVYDYGHIGNYRTFVFQDILRRYLRYRGYETLQVMNLTDVDDKTIRSCQQAGMALRDYTEKYIEAFRVDSELLNLDKPEIVVRATDHIDDMVKLIQVLEAKGYTYRSDGSVYYRIEKFKDYGKLSKIDLAGNLPGARVDFDEYGKADARDFVLWKAAKEGEPFWDTPLGPGRPGWHIECSAMAMKCLGETLDIHSGGTDLIFPHHENEIAQSEAATGKPFARYWLHAEHLIVNGEKMSKSLGNFYTLRDLIAQGHRPSAIRYLLASVPYRRHLNFTFEGLHQAQQSLERLRNFRLRLTTEKFLPGKSEELAARAETAREAFQNAMDDNLNTAEALAAIFELVRHGNTAMDRSQFREDNRAGFLDVLERWDRVFAVLDDTDYDKLVHFRLMKPVQVTVSDSSWQLRDSVELSMGGADALPIPMELLSEEEIRKRISERDAARRRRDFARADQVRKELAGAGIILEDTRSGTRWRRK